MNTVNKTVMRGAAGLIAALLLLAPPAQSGTTTSTFQVQITLVSSCAISATNLNFGSSIGLLSSAVNGSTTLSVTCSNSIPYTVGLDGGTVSGSTTANRLMAGTATGNTTTTLPFQLYSDSGRATLWGNASGSWISGSGNGAAQTLTVYGQVPAQTTPKPDTYQTTITATVSY